LPRKETFRKEKRKETLLIWKFFRIANKCYYGSGGIPPWHYIGRIVFEEFFRPDFNTCLCCR
jgi:hypothetical protein